MADRAPPHDLDAEAAVLSAVLLERDVYDAIADVLTPEHFFSESNRRIYEAAGELARDGAPIDIVSAAGVLRDRGRLTQIGGPAYLAQLVNATPAVAHVEAYARRVRDKWAIRQVIANCQRLAAEGYGGDVGDVTGFVDRAVESFRGLGDVAGESSMVTIAQAVQEKFDGWRLSAAGVADGGAIRTGFAPIDRQLRGGLRGQKLYLLAARPGVGKSALALNVATAVGGFGGGVAFFSMEMSRQELIDRQLAALSGVPLDTIAAFSDPMVREARMREVALVDRAGVHLGRHPIWIDDAGSLGLMNIRSRCKKIDAEIKRNGGTGLALIVVDYVGLMKEPDGARTREQAIAYNSRGLKLLSKEMKVPVLLLSQMNRAIEQRTGKAARPKLSDLRESGSLEQDADVVMFLHRDDPEQKEGPTELIVAKQRGGPPGSVELYYRGYVTRFDSPMEAA